MTLIKQDDYMPDSSFANEKDTQIINNAFRDFTTKDIYYLIRYAAFRHTSVAYHIELMKSFA